MTACPLLADKRQTAFDTPEPPISDLEQLAVLDQLLKHAQDLEATHGHDISHAGFATALGAFAPLLQRLPSKSENGPSPLTAVKHWATRWGAHADRLGASTTVLCPDCAAGHICPTEQWHRQLANRLFAVKLRTHRPGTDPDKRLFEQIVRPPTSGSHDLPSTFRALLAANLPAVADELLELACIRLEAEGRVARAHSMRTEAWDHLDGRGPLLARWKAEQVAAHPDKAIAICTAVLDRMDCPPGPSQRLLVTALSQHQRRQMQRQRLDQIDTTTPSGRAILSRRRPTRRIPSLFGLDGEAS